MSEGDELRPRFRSQVKKDWDVHLPISITEKCGIRPGDHVTLELVPAVEGHDKPFKTSHEVELQAQRTEAEELGRSTFNHYLPLWMKNFKASMDILKNPKSIDDIHAGKEKFGVVVGAGPSLKETDWEELKNFKGVIVATNKALKPLLENGIVPQWVCALDGEPVVYESFCHEIVKKHSGKINFAGPTVLHPSVIEFVSKWAKESFWGNPHIPSAHDSDQWNLNVVLELMNDLPLLRHGGNVGTFAWLIAKSLGCNPIGMLGFDMCFTPSPKWTREQVIGYEYIYNPDKDEILALDAPFRAYISILAGATDLSWNEEPPVMTVNLTPRGALYMSGFFPNFTLKEFIKEKGVKTRALEKRQSELKRMAESVMAAKEAQKPIFRDDY